MIRQALVAWRQDVLLLCLQFFLWLCFRPVIHIMGDVVTIAAFLELGHNACRMRRPMTVPTVGDHPVFFLMAGWACQGLVLGFAGAKEVKGLFVAYAAVF